MSTLETQADKYIDGLHSKLSEVCDNIPLLRSLPGIYLKILNSFIMDAIIFL